MFADSFCTSSSLDRTRRGWTTLVSFVLQAFGLSVLLILPVIYTEGLPQVRLRDLLLAPPPALAPAPALPRPTIQPAASSNAAGGRFIFPSRVPLYTLPNPDLEPAPGLPVSAGPGIGVFQGNHDDLNQLTRAFSHVAAPVAVTLPPVKPRPLSRRMEGNLIRKVQPVYPLIAKSAGIQGTVLLSAVIGRDGRIEHVQVTSGHPLLAKAAVDAVSQWLYRPYYLNDQPVEVETQVTVNFILGR